MAWKCGPRLCSADCLICKAAHPSFGQHRDSRMQWARDSLGLHWLQVYTVNIYGLEGLQMEK